MKAVEQLQRWCDKHWCDKCPFAYVIKDDHGITPDYDCYLNELPPYQWGQVRFNGEKVEE